MGQRLKGKNAVVTGAGRGIGRAIALALAAEGASVVVNDLGGGPDGIGADAAPADEVVQEIKNRGGLAVANYDSVADFAAADRLIKSCVDNFGRLDILVNCAGIVRGGTIYEMSEEDWDAVINIHLKGTFNCCRHACALMAQQGSGRIINTTSETWLGTVGGTAYPAAKGGIVSLTRSIAREMGRYGVTCNAIAPEAATRMTMNEMMQAGFRLWYEAGYITKERMDELLDMAGPEAVAPIVLYLATDEAANINGRVFWCGAGRVALFSEPEEVKAIYKDHKKDGPWTLDELVELVPRTLAVGLVNPAPPELS
jgi:NAD(P)-dependent dehydrogenase (short-subunit alcohol dehydrogenase family)